MRICILTDEEIADFNPASFMEGFDWEMVTMTDPVMDVLRSLDARKEFDLYLNLCEGYEKDPDSDWEYEGIDVIRALETLNLPFTGADSKFFDPTRDEMKNAARLITLASIGQILGYAYALPGHIGESTWSDHAQFHHVLAWIWLVGLDTAIVAFAWGPLQKRDKMSFWLLLVLFIPALVGHFMASAVVPAGRPSEWWYDYALGTMTLIFALGLFMAWKALARQDPS